MYPYDVPDYAGYPYDVPDYAGSYPYDVPDYAAQCMNQIWSTGPPNFYFNSEWKENKRNDRTPKLKNDVTALNDINKKENKEEITQENYTHQINSIPLTSSNLNRHFSFSRGYNQSDNSNNNYYREYLSKPRYLQQSTKRFFVIKSSSLKHVKRSFYNGIWSSTHFGNKRLSEAYKKLNSGAKVFLFFSINTSGRFCGVAEMVSDLKMDLDTSIWEDEQKYGKAFKVRWVIVRDINNRSLKRFLIPSNEMKPITHSRDTQEIPYSIGISIINLFKTQDSDIFSFLDETYE